VKDITQNHNVIPQKLDVNGKVIPLGTCHKRVHEIPRRNGVVYKKRM
jgi:hypothetical protein